MAAGPPAVASRRRVQARLIAADLVGLFAFALLGLRAHMVGSTPVAVLRIVGPLWIAWGVIGAWRGAFRTPSWAALLQTWLLAVPAALVARQLLLGRPFGRGFLVFVLVALVMTLACVLVARVVAARLARGGGAA